MKGRLTETSVLHFSLKQEPELVRCSSQTLKQVPVTSFWNTKEAYSSYISSMAARRYISVIFGCFN